MIKVKFSFNKTAFKESAAKELSTLLDVVSEDILNDLRQATPKDTGAAAASWQTTTKDNFFFEIINEKDYVKYLNAGSSKQAPPRFIEQVALSYGKPSGPVVDYD